jgi:hypothetical protein
LLLSAQLPVYCDDDTDNLLENGSAADKIRRGASDVVFSTEKYFLLPFNTFFLSLLYHTVMPINKPFHHHISTTSLG